MNGFTIMALVIICLYVLYTAIKILEKRARDIAREQGKRRALEHRAMQMRMEKDGDYNCKGEW